MSHQPNDPAILDSSIMSMSASSDKNAASSSLALFSTATEHSLRENTNTNGGYQGNLEPGSALSKLLDSAMANAAKELTPEPDSTRSPTHLASPRRSSLLAFKPPSSQKANVYSIEELLALRSAPEVANFDTSVLPELPFWCIKPHKPKNHQQNGSGNKRNSRRNQNQQQNDFNGKWERKPTGFAKSSEVDTMSAEKISQLLGENPEEGTPEWDLPGGGNDMQMDMGSTVEDFERWKQRMREGERKQYGEVEASPAESEAPRGNEVDNFFSFVKPKAGASSVPESTTSSDAGKTSRFSSFFGGPGVEESPKRTAPPPGLERSAQAGRVPESAGLRFFGMAQGSPAQQNLTPKQEPMGGTQQPQMQQQMPQQRPPPMMQGSPASGGPPGLSFPMGGDGNKQDSFFLSLMKKRDLQQDVPQRAGELAEGLPLLKSDKGAPQGNPGIPGQGPQGARQNMPQGVPPYMGNPQMGGNIPPGFQRAPQHMYQFQGPPAGMFPPGMNMPPGMPPQGFPQMQGRPGQSREGQPNQGMFRGQMPPPGFYGFPPGMNPGMPPQQLPQQRQQIPQQQQQQQQLQQGPPKQ